mmetsp:Transcript_3573/g.5068  ORF Transcript_3573/g.5068 Transcript_3573/m.5068 type:complete len:106 (+) Transcript_3573:624-941(+)
MVEHLQESERLEEQHITLEASKVNSAADVEGGDVSEVVNEGGEGEEHLIDTSSSPQGQCEQQVQHIALVQQPNHLSCFHHRNIIYVSMRSKRFVWKLIFHATNCS